MAKFEEVFKDTKTLFDKQIVASGLDATVTIKLLTDNTLNKIAKVIKSPDWVRFETKNDVYIFLNEEVFVQIDKVDQEIIAEEILASISINESGNISLDKGDIQTYSLLLAKHTYKKYAEIKTKVSDIFNEIKITKELNKSSTASTSNTGKKK